MRQTRLPRLSLRRPLTAAGLSAALLGFAACVGCGKLPQSKEILVDGSSTVEPILLAAAELFRSEAPDVQVNVSASGTGGGFKKFTDEQPELRTDISNASRPIRDEERARAAQVGVEFLELPIAYDGLSIVVHPSNDFCDQLSVEELRRMWSRREPLTNWRQVRASFPDLPLRLYGPGHDSGTYDYFVEAIVHDKNDMRSDYIANENDNVLVQGVSKDRGALGFFGFAYFEANADRLKLLAIDGGNGKAIKPSRTTIASGEYTPLSRPMFVYVNKAAARRDEVRRFIEFLLNDPRRFVEHPEVGYVGLPDSLYSMVRARFREGRSGSVYANGGHASRLEVLFGPVGS